MVTQLERVAVFYGLLMACSLAGCAENPFRPEFGMPLPTDPGTISVRVTNRNGAPQFGVSVAVNNIPNKVGSYYTVSQRTDSKGMAVFAGIDAGIRQVALPDYVPLQNDQDYSRDVTVIKHATVSVEFLLPPK